MAHISSCVYPGVPANRLSTSSYIVPPLSPLPSGAEVSLSNVQSNFRQRLQSLRSELKLLLHPQQAHHLYPTDNTQRPEAEALGLEDGSTTTRHQEVPTLPEGSVHRLVSQGSGPGGGLRSRHGTKQQLGKGRQVHHRWPAIQTQRPQPIGTSSPPEGQCA